MGTFHFHFCFGCSQSTATVQPPGEQCRWDTRHEVAWPGRKPPERPPATQHRHSSLDPDWCVARAGEEADPQRAPGSSKATPGTMLVIVVGICALLLTCRPVPLLSQLVTFSPENLSRPAGDTASFFCNISTANFPQFDYSLNWYKKINSTHTQKIAELNGNEHKNHEKFQLVNHTSSVEIKIQYLNENDSGEYFCGLIAFSSPSKVVESNVSQLKVTEGIPTTVPNVIDDDLADNFKVPVIIGLIIAGAVLLGLITYVLFMITRRTGGQQKPQRENALLKEQVTTYTVDYGVLEFQQDEHTEAPVESYPPDNTEYAVIVFPEEKPVTPERGKKTKHQRTCQI
ncbi:programmed cell death protein 1-like isoform X1 [Mauremys reevesii]|uniref:programmed cell death protein 1-like isoform X1 n=1 Tax=Mauremys reevesii TaxID=260615 RepID=UPI00193FBF90|nr:programmed cell death protein 1-like isoform X1 [Mauremys reevesii]